MTQSAVTAQDLADYVISSHRQGYSVGPVARTVRLLARNDRVTMHAVNDLFQAYIGNLANGWQLVPTGKTINSLLDDLGPDLPSVR